jgi:hypothetical protein
MLQLLSSLPEAPRSIAMRDGQDLAAGAPLLLDGFRLVGTAADVPPRERRVAALGDRRVSVFRSGRGFAAVDAGGDGAAAVHEIAEREGLLYVRLAERPSGQAPAERAA